MHISNISIKNFRGIKNLLIEDLKTVNVFLGKNNVGKTSILEAIFLSMASNNPTLIITIDNFRQLLHNQADDFSFIFYQLNYNNTVEIDMKYAKDDIERELKITPILKNTISLSSQRDVKVNNFEETSSANLNNLEKTNAVGLSLAFSYKKKHSKRETYLAKIELENDAFKQTPAKFIEPFKGIFLSSNAIYTNLSARFEKVFVNKQENEIIEFLKPVDNSIQGLSLGLNNVLFCDTGFGRRFPINLLGEGVVKLLGIILAIYDASNGIVIVDEFSNGLHFSALKALWKAVSKAAKFHKVQLFFTTHDYEVLKFLKEVLEEEEFISQQSDVRSYTIRKLAEGDFKSYKYDFAKLELAINEENEIR